MSVCFSRTWSSWTPARFLFSRRQEKYRIVEPIMPVAPVATASPYPVSEETSCQRLSCDPIGWSKTREVFWVEG